MNSRDLIGKVWNKPIKQKPGHTEGTQDGGIAAAVRGCMEFCEWRRWVPRNSTVVLKPNLCTAIAEQIESSNTKLAVTEAVCEVLLERTNRISVVEADHIRQTTEHVYDATGYNPAEKKYGISLVNLSKTPKVECKCEPIGEIALPRMLLECNAFISIPVLKTHALTYFTGVLKNQWGCVPMALDRIQRHSAIHEMLSSLYRLLHPQFSVMDATVCMEGRGPVAGKARQLDVILASHGQVGAERLQIQGARNVEGVHQGLRVGQGQAGPGGGEGVAADQGQALRSRPPRSRCG